MRFLLSSWGSRGDLHPFLSLGQTLRARGHGVTLVGNPDWSSAVTGARLDFLPAGPTQTNEFLATIPDIASQAEGGRRAIRALMKNWFSPAFDDVYRVLCEAAPQHDCLVAHHVSMIASAVAETTGIPWATVVLAPCIIPSSYTLPLVFSRRPFRGPLGRVLNALLWTLARRGLGQIVDPYLDRFRLAHGLQPMRDVAFRTGLSRELLLTLYSRHFAAPEPDWSAEKKQAGFCFWDPISAEAFQPPADLVAFLAAAEKAGRKPWLFTLGTTMIADPQGFYQAAVESVRGTPERAILLVGRMENAPPNPPENVLVLAYAPFGWLIPRCAAVAHQCGIGTCAQVLRAGLPSVGCPYAFDQAANASQLAALGVGIVLPRERRRAADLRDAFTRLLASEDASRRAQALATALRAEDGPTRAAEILEKFVNERTAAAGARSSP
ncbi:MAG: glycosyltransferase [Verrucomicrobia bacterium]|nr:glycosyltransferase [Verrucomicrobiota bacterium]